jgi:hypothetical protein
VPAPRLPRLRHEPADPTERRSPAPSPCGRRVCSHTLPGPRQHIHPRSRRVRYSGLLHPLRSSATWGNAGPHSAQPGIADKDEVPGSSPGRPTTHHPRSERCRQRDGRARCQLGPRWGRTPIPAGKPIGPAGPVHPGGRLHYNHAPWSPTQPQHASHAAGAATSRCSLLRAYRAAASHGRSARRPGLPGRAAGTRGRHPLTQPGRVRRRHSTDQRATSVVSPASSRPRPLTEPLGRRGSHWDLDSFPWCRLPRRTHLVPSTTA